MDHGVTGFVVDPRVYMQGFPVRGLPGHELARDWRDGAEAYYGLAVAGYPNLHQLVGPNTALGHNSVIFMIEGIIALVLSCVGGIGMSYFSFALRAAISATTFSVIGNICKVLTILVNSVMWDQHASKPPPPDADPSKDTESEKRIMSQATSSRENVPGYIAIQSTKVRTARGSIWFVV